MIHQWSDTFHNGHICATLSSARVTALVRATTITCKIGKRTITGYPFQYGSHYGIGSTFTEAKWIVAEIDRLTSRR